MILQHNQESLHIAVATSKHTWKACSNKGGWREDGREGGGGGLAPEPPVQ